MESFFKFYCVLATIAVHSVVVQGVDYCATYCGDQHIGCRHPNTFAPVCSEPQLVPIPYNIRQILIDEHNKDRNLIAGGGDPNHDKACRMASIAWDDELERLAVLNAYQCQIHHDYCHDTANFRASGQNLYENYRLDYGTFNDTEEFIKGVEAWFQERRLSNRQYIAAYPDSDFAASIGHFTCLVTERNTHLGCAASIFLRGSTRVFLLVCNYAGNNIVFNPIYKTCPVAGSDCTRRSSVYPNLCAEGEDYGELTYIIPGQR